MNRFFKAKMIILIFLFSAMSAVSFAQMRVWRKVDGSLFMAEFSRANFGSYYFETADGETIKLSEDSLIESDREHLRNMFPPKINLRVTKKTAPTVRNTKFVWSGDYMDTVTLSVAIKKMNKEPYDGFLNVEVFLVGAEVATSHFHMSGMKSFPVKLSDDKKAPTEIAFSANFRRYEDYNDEVRGRNYEGYAIIVSDTNGKVLLQETDLDWLEDDQFADLQKLYEGAFFNERCMKTSVPRPKYADNRKDL